MNVPLFLNYIIKSFLFIRFSHIPFYKTGGTGLVSISGQEIVLRKFYRAIHSRNRFREAVNDNRGKINY